METPSQASQGLVQERERPWDAGDLWSPTASPPALGRGPLTTPTEGQYKESRREGEGRQPLFGVWGMDAQENGGQEGWR